MWCPVNHRECESTGCVNRCMLEPFTTPPNLPPHQLGWQCPKCGRGNAPWKPSCECGPNIAITISDGSASTTGKN